MSDMDILATIVIFFITLGTVMPFIHASFNEAGTDLNSEGVEFEAGQDLPFSNVSILGVILSIFTMFFWTFGNIPLLLDLLLFVPLRIIFVVLLYKLIRGVGG